MSRLTQSRRAVLRRCGRRRASGRPADGPFRRPCAAGAEPQWRPGTRPATARAPGRSRIRQRRRATPRRWPARWPGAGRKGRSAQNAAHLPSLCPRPSTHCVRFKPRAPTAITWMGNRETQARARNSLFLCNHTETAAKSCVCFLCLPLRLTICSWAHTKFSGTLKAENTTLCIRVIKQQLI